MTSAVEFTTLILGLHHGEVERDVIASAAEVQAEIAAARLEGRKAHFRTAEGTEWSAAPGCLGVLS